MYRVEQGSQDRGYFIQNFSIFHFLRSPQNQLFKSTINQKHKEVKQISRAVLMESGASCQDSFLADQRTLVVRLRWSLSSSIEPLSDLQVISKNNFKSNACHLKIVKKKQRKLSLTKKYSFPSSQRSGTEFGPDHPAASSAGTPCYSVISLKY